ncbi:MAG: efflux transporter outer membrane subunit, partial [Puniceicoccales bacterium]|nr:efflux transporter outer membrane subunit [Puniceicoccales bacterium]
MNSSFSASITRLLAAAAVLSITACSKDDAVSETREDLRRSVKVQPSWRNHPGTTAKNNAVPLAEPTDEQRALFDRELPSKAGTDRLLLSVWAKQFNDPVLEQIVTAALYSSPDLRSMLSRVAEARARRGLERANLLPTINGYLDARQNYRRDHKVTHRTTSSDLYTAGFAATWEIDLFGKYRASTDAATAEIAVTEENFRGAQISLVAEIAETYVLLREAEARLGVIGRNVDTREETARISKWREETGTGDAFEAQQATSSLAQARAALPPIRHEIEQARIRLAILAGKTPGALDSVLDTKSSVTLPENATDADKALATLPVAPAADLKPGVPAVVLSRRPDIGAASKAAIAASLRRKSTEREWYPTINLSGAIGIEALKAGNLFSPEATVGSVLAGLTQPIFNGWRISQNIDISTEIQKQAVIEYEVAVLNALGEVEDALFAVRSAAERLDTLKKATNIAADNARIANFKYQSGLTDFTDVLETQRVKLSLEEQTLASAAEQS